MSEGDAGAGDGEKTADAVADEEGEEKKPIPARTRSVNGAVSVDGVTYTDYDSPFAIEREFSGLNNMHHLSQNSWVGCGDDVFVLDLMGHGQFTVQPGQDGPSPLLLVNGRKR